MSVESSSPEQVFAMVPDEVTDAGSYIQQVAESLINGLNTLDREVAAALTTWTGTAAESFDSGWTETKEGAADVLDALAAMAALLGVTSKIIAHQDTAGASTFHSLDLPILNM
ncbi:MULTISPECIES: WXG100 family type VII secretion target [Nocardia]|uniref:WXG100 family type VII secretion target n=1 Tax=Nocardia TaxID=1817 RepID=UPI001428A3DC|nr:MULTISPECIES: WXG100 family type VII secretion target [Nocardia]